MTAIRFTATDMDHAYATWSCSCGPTALAAICGLTLDEVRPLFLPAFPGWTTPTRMLEALRRSGRQWSALRPGLSGAPLPWPRWGLARIQWHGPWTMSGASQRWAYRHTHWIGAATYRPADRDLVDVFDVNELSDQGNGWLPLSDWTARTVPALTRGIPRATGDWHITHAIEVQR